MTKIISTDLLMTALVRLTGIPKKGESIMPGELFLAPSDKDYKEFLQAGYATEATAADKALYQAQHASLEPEGEIPSGDDLEDKTPDELHEIAESEGIDVGKLRSPEKLIARIREGRSGSDPLADL